MQTCTKVLYPSQEEAVSRQFEEVYGNHSRRLAAERVHSCEVNFDISGTNRKCDSVVFSGDLIVTQDS